MLCRLDDILAYQHPAVVRRFQKEHPQSADRAEEIFGDLMRFFWGTRKHRLDRTQAPSDDKLDFFFIMDDDMREIDQMWHVFLLYTRDYEQFCQRYFGEFLHHQPDLVPYFEQQGFRFEANLEKFLDYGVDLFGEDVIRRWFAPTLNAA